MKRKEPATNGLTALLLNLHDYTFDLKYKKQENIC